MDAGQELAQLKQSLRSGWKTSPDPVWRLLLLRGFFHSLHQLLNMLLARDPGPRPEGLSELHEALSTFPSRASGTPASRFIQALVQAGDPLVFLSKSITQAATSPGWPGLPAFLQQPGREWEALIYWLALSCGWQARREDLRLETPSQIEHWLTQARTPHPDHAVLALERNPAESHTWWAHSIRRPA